MLDFILSHKLEVATCALAVVGAASVVLNVVAPLTKTLVDDKALRALLVLRGLLEKLALNVKK